MAAQYEPHVIAVMKTDRAAAKAFGEGHVIRRQAPIHLGRWSKPEPDIAVLAGELEDFIASGPPTSALLLTEVSDATLSVDRGKKLALYAKHGIQDYWILNLVARQLEVHRRPISDPSARYKFRYAEMFACTAEQEIAPLARPQSPISVADMLPAVIGQPKPLN
jgi:Uma2 family endonuclease